jgi:hypothetical protein
MPTRKDVKKKKVREHRYYGRKKRLRNAFSGVRTDTKPERIIRKNGGLYIERKNGSKYPHWRHFTTISVNRPVARILKVMKEVGGYPNWDEFMWEMVFSRIEAKSLPKVLVDRAKYDINLRRQAREKAIAKHTYYPHEHRIKDRDYKLVKEAVHETLRKIEKAKEMKRKHKVLKKKRKQKGSPDKE